MITTFVQALMGAEADAVCGARVRRPVAARADQHPQRLPASGLGHPRRHRRVGDPEARYMSCQVAGVGVQDHRRPVGRLPVTEGGELLRRSRLFFSRPHADGL